MKKRTKVTLSILFGILVILGGFAFWQRENVAAVLTFLKYSQEELETQMAENQKAMEQVIANTSKLGVRDLTEEEKQAVREGKIDAETLVSRLTNMQPVIPNENGLESTPNVEQNSGVELTNPEQTEAVQETAQVEAAQAETTQAETAAPAYAAENQRLSELVARVYVLRERYVGALNGMKASAEAEYHALPKEQKGRSAMLNIANSYISRAGALEDACDAEILAIVNEMETIIQHIGGDASLPDVVLNSYINEKNLKKAWYMSELEKRGMK